MKMIYFYFTENGVITYETQVGTKIDQKINLKGNRTKSGVIKVRG